MIQPGTPFAVGVFPGRRSGLIMSSKTRYKWIRAIPGVIAASDPGYYSYNLPNMKQIPTQIFTAISAAGPSTLASAFVPANSWAMGKLLMIRAFYVMTLPGAGTPPTYNIAEGLGITGAGVTPLPTPAAFIPAPGTFSTWIQRHLIRIDPDIWVLDQGDCMQFNFANFTDNVQHVIQVPALVPPYDYTAQIQVDLLATIPPTYPGVTMQCMWCESFLEQGTNLGKLP